MLGVACCIKGHSPTPIDSANPSYLNFADFDHFSQKETNFESRILARVKTITGLSKPKGMRNKGCLPSHFPWASAACAKR
jgi:hypothetical protein